jgi:flagellum-specific ATP synthase
MSGLFDGLLAEISGKAPLRRVGRVVETRRGLVEVAGLDHAAIGDRVVIHSRDGSAGGEVLRLIPGRCSVLPDASGDGMAIDDRVELWGKAEIAPDDSWIGRVVDPTGQPLDGRPLLRGPKNRALRAPAPPAALRRRLGARLARGLRSLTRCCRWCRGSGSGFSPDLASENPRCWPVSRAGLKRMLS